MAPRRRVAIAAIAAFATAGLVAAADASSGGSSEWTRAGNGHTAAALCSGYILTGGRCDGAHANQAQVISASGIGLRPALAACSSGYILTGGRCVPA